MMLNALAGGSMQRREFSIVSPELPLPPNPIESRGKLAHTSYHNLGDYIYAQRLQEN